jgi:hypothetical protein
MAGDWEKFRVLVKAVMSSIKGGEFLGWEIISYSSRTSLHGDGWWFRDNVLTLRCQRLRFKYQAHTRRIVPLKNINPHIWQRENIGILRKTRNLYKICLVLQTATNRERRNWIQLAQHGIRWGTLVHTVLYLQVPQNCFFTLSSCGLSETPQRFGQLGDLLTGCPPKQIRISSHYILKFSRYRLCNNNSVRRRGTERERETFHST